MFLFVQQFNIMQSHLKILITGGAGYVGSCLAHRLAGLGYQTFIFDDLSAGFEIAVPKNTFFQKGSILDATMLNAFVKSNEINFIIHLADKSNAGQTRQ